MVAALGAHDLYDAVVVVAAGWVDWDAGGFVDDDYVFVFVDDAYGLGGDWGFVSVEGVGDDVAVFDLRVGRLDWLAIDRDLSRY